MNPEEFFSFTDNPGYQIGQGKRGMRSEQEYNTWVSYGGQVKVTCTNPQCNATMMINREDWLNNIPTTCINNHESLSHQYLIENAFMYEKVKKNGEFVVEEITEPFRRACLVNWVKIKII